MSSSQTFRVLPGFNLTLGYTLAWLGLIVLLPLAAVLLKAATLTWPEFWAVVTAPRVLASYRLSFGTALLAAGINAVFGLMLAWALVRYSFPAKRLVDALVDLPFALPTAVAGIALTAIYAKNGWLGQYLEPQGIHVAFKPPGILVALIFIGLPFVVRTVQPILEDFDTELEEAAASLGAHRWQIDVYKRQIQQRALFSADSRLSGTNGLTVTCQGAACGTSHQGTILGSFFGNEAAAAAMSYKLTKEGANMGSVSGTAVFKRP